MAGLLLATVIGYVLGMIPAGYLLVRATRGVDVRTEGSGNIGATNVLRTSGRAAGILTLLLDIAKGAAAVLISRWIGATPPELAGALALFGVVLGHVFPASLRFRGGKGVACAIGASLALYPLLSLAAAGALVATVALTRWVSLGSIVFALVFPLAVLFHAGPLPAFPWLAAASGLVIVRHADNIRRLAAGTEHRLGQR